MTGLVPTLGYSLWKLSPARSVYDFRMLGSVLTAGCLMTCCSTTNSLLTCSGPYLDYGHQRPALDTSR